MQEHLREWADQQLETPPPRFSVLVMLTSVVGALALAVAWFLATRSTLTGFEEAVFRGINDLPDWLVVPTWPIMQFGALWFVPVAAALGHLIWRSKRDSLLILVGGAAAWVSAAIIKQIVERGRPQDYFADANLRPELGGFGFVSGHTAVAFALATVLAHLLGRTGAIIAYGAALAVGLLRIFVGAHLPLDVVGGAAVGVFVGLATLDFRERPRRRAARDRAATSD